MKAVFSSSSTRAGSGKNGEMRKAKRREAKGEKARATTKRTDKVDQVLADRGLAARESDFVDALLDKEARYPQNLVGGEELCVWCERDALLGHAVLACQFVSEKKKGE